VLGAGILTARLCRLKAPGRLVSNVGQTIVFCRVPCSAERQATKRRWPAPQTIDIVISMVDTVVEALIRDLLSWLAKGERDYDDVMDAWRTSCPRLPVWEDANDLGLVALERLNGRTVVRITPGGLAFLGRK
jgi:hypothetical protein